MTKLEIINETAEFYMADPSRRALDQESCTYITDDGRKCAVGRYLKDPKLAVLPGIGSVCDFDDLESWLKPKYRGHEVDFWDKLQFWHDHPPCWGTKGLTSKGQVALENLRNLYTTT